MHEQEHDDRGQGHDDRGQEHGRGRDHDHGRDPDLPEKRYWLDDPANVRKIYGGLWAVCLFLVGADLLYHKHAHYGVESLWGFFGFYGFVSCVLLVLAAKQLRKLVMRDEDYYDR